MPALTREARSRAAWELAFALLVLATVYPLWVGRYLPIQDLPQHLAAIRVLHSYGDASFQLERYFELDLFRTQYLVYYLATHLLAYVFDLELANRLLVSSCVIATPYALRALLGALERDLRLALMALPLTYNAHLILGFVNFLIAIALALYGLALAVRQRRAFSRGRACGLAAVALACFYAHVVPFALFALGVGLLALTRSPASVLRQLLPLAPAGLAGLAWVARSPAGQATLTAARGAERGPQPVFLPVEVSLADLPNWLTDVLHGDADLRLLRWYGLIVLLTLPLAVLPRMAAVPSPLARSCARRLSPLAPIAAALYFFAPTGYDWIWPIAQRFPLLALLLVVPVLPVPPPGLARSFALAIALVTVLQVREVAGAFERFDAEEVGDFDAAVNAIPPGRRVVGLIFARGSRHVKFSPFIQYVAYYQARAGGAVMFTFADFPQSPFRFREGDRPPRVPPRWEWMPQLVRPADLGWYDYALVRGAPHFAPCARSGWTAGNCAPIYRGSSWSVWKLK